MRLSISLAFLMSCLIFYQHELPAQTVDIVQPKIFLQYVETIQEGKDATAIIDRLMDAEGTKLIIDQNNLVRTLSHDQYREMLAAVAKSKVPKYETSKMSPREKGGVAAIERAIYPRIKWASTNADWIRNAIEEFSNVDVLQQSLDKAVNFLPEDLTLSPKLYFVMGGRAGAASLRNGRLYFDLLAMGYSPSRGNVTDISPEMVIDYFAHEIHHLGFDKVNSKLLLSLDLSKNEKHVFDILSGIVAEGSATFLISAGCDIGNLENDHNFKELLANPELLLSKAEEIFRELLSGELHSEARSEELLKIKLGHNLHATGAILFETLNSVYGKDKLLEIISDPRNLLIDFNRAVKEPGAEKNVSFEFDASLAEQIVKIGNPGD